MHLGAWVRVPSPAVLGVSVELSGETREITFSMCTVENYRVRYDSLQVIWHPERTPQATGPTATASLIFDRQPNVRGGKAIAMGTVCHVHHLQAFL